MSGAEKNIWEQAFERGLARGREEGAADEKSAGVWHIPEIRPKHTESIIAVMKPYNWGSRRYCRKNGLKYVRVSGVFLNGDELAIELGDDPGEYSDLVIVDARHAVEWDNVVLWTSAELPEWFDMREE